MDRPSSSAIGAAGDFPSFSLLFIGEFFLIPIAHLKILVASIVHREELCKPLGIRGASQLLEGGKNRHIWHPGFPFAGAVALQALLELNFKEAASDLGGVEATEFDEFFALFYGRVGVIDHYRKSLLQGCLDQLSLLASRVAIVSQQVFAHILIGVPKAAARESGFAGCLQANHYD